MSRKTNKLSIRQSSSSNINGELILECKAVYLSIYDSLQDNIENREDFITVLQQSGRNPTTRVISKYWKSHSDSLSFDEFCDVCKNEPATTSDDLMRAFRRIDLNNDGYLSLQELYKMMTTKGDIMSLEEVKQMLDEVDENKDGRLDYGEFCNMVISTSDDCKKMTLRLMERRERQKQRALTHKPPPSSRHDRDNDPDDLDTTSDVLSDRGSVVSLSSSHKFSDGPRAAPRRREDKPKSPASRTRPIKDRASLAFEDWRHHAKMKGCFYVEDDNTITNHWYTLKLPVSSTVHISIQSIKLGSLDCEKVDMGVVVLRGRDGQHVVACTDTQDSKGRMGGELELAAGTYTLIPYTSGCRLNCRKHAPRSEVNLVKKDRDTDRYSLTRQFRTALEEIFDLCDLDDNGLLSREEFNQFNIRTSGEEVPDDEWKVVEDNVEMEKGQINKAGFIRLNEMEVEDNEGDADDSWLTLSNMGYNKALVMDEACPFMVEIRAERGEGLSLRLRGMESATNEVLQRALISMATTQGEATRVKGIKDVTTYTYKNDLWAYIVAENKSHNEVKLKLDCHASRNCISNLPGMIGSVEIPSSSTIMVAQFVADGGSSDWSVSCVETTHK